MASIVQLALDDSNIILRQIQDSDAEALWIIIESERDYLRKYLNWIDDTRNINDVHTFIQNCNKSTENLRGITFLILEDEKVMGSVALYDWLHAVKCIHLGYWISAHKAGQGIISKVAKRILEYAFDDLEMNKVQLYFIPENVASERVADKLGFKIEGYVRQSYFLNGIIKDQYLAGLLNEEYRFKKNTD